MAKNVIIYDIKRALQVLLCTSIAFIYIISFKMTTHRLSRLENRRVNISHLRPVRIFCFILTSPSSLESRAELVYDAWAKECDGLKFITVLPHNMNNKSSSGLVRSEFLYNNKLPLLQPARLYQEIYKNLTEKVFATVIDIYRNYVNEYDFFLKADDDTFIFMDHLRMFLAQTKVKKTYYGYNFKWYLSGGAGYVLTRDCLKTLAEALINKPPTKCTRSGVEDMDIATCLLDLGILSTNSIDAQGRERFHPFKVSEHWFPNKLPDWMYTASLNGIQNGVGCCSDTTISFHYMTGFNLLKLSQLWNEYRYSRETVDFMDVIAQAALEPQF